VGVYPRCTRVGVYPRCTRVGIPQGVVGYTSGCGRVGYTSGVVGWGILQGVQGVSLRNEAGSEARLLPVSLLASSPARPLSLLFPFHCWPVMKLPVGHSLGE